MSRTAKRPRVPCLFASPLVVGLVSYRAALTVCGGGALCDGDACREVSVFVAARPEACPPDHAPVVVSVSATAASPVQQPPERPRRRLSDETKRKIAAAMLGRPKSDEMRAKVSEKLKGRVPWNKGKKLSLETRARMSEARFGRSPWNKGLSLSAAHRTAISASTQSRVVSEATRVRMRMARRRPGDAIVAGGVPSDLKNGAYPLVETSDINIYVTLRRELRGWSDDFADRNGRRPSLADVRRNAPPAFIRKFEQYAAMRDRLRGLASDVYGTINPECVPVVKPRDTASAPQNNNAGTVLQYTSHGNPRLVPKHPSPSQSAKLSKELLREYDEDFGTSSSNGDFDGDMVVTHGGQWGQWDEYDVPTRGDYSSGFQVCESIVKPVHDTKGGDKKDEFSVNDYRLIGKYRLMEAIDINTYMELRRDLTSWSSAFKEKHGRTPALSDVRSTGDSEIYRKFCRYIEARDRMDGLVREVCGTEITDEEKIKKLAMTGRALVNRLRPQSPPNPLPPSERTSSPTLIRRTRRIKLGSS